MNKLVLFPLRHVQNLYVKREAGTLQSLLKRELRTEKIADLKANNYDRQAQCGYIELPLLDLEVCSLLTIRGYGTECRLDLLCIWLCICVAD